MSLCSICLRTNLTLNTVGSALISFYDDLLDHEIFPNLRLCETCEHLLKKCYDFKLLCQKSNKVLQDWKKKKKPEISTDALHFLIRSYYDNLCETKDEKDIKSESENDIVIVLDDNEDLIPNNDDTIECDDNRTENNGTEIEDIHYNDILSKSIALSHLNFTSEPKGGTEFNLNVNQPKRRRKRNDKYEIEIKNDCDNTHNSGNNSENKSNRIGDDCHNHIETDPKIINNKISKKGNKVIVKVKKQKKPIQKEIIKKNRGRNPLKNKEIYESIFDIVYFKTDEEARAELLQRPNTDYYKNADFKCTVCYSVFKWQKMLDYHMKWHDPAAGDHVCHICEMRFDTRKRMLKHKAQAHYGRFNCKKCSFLTHRTSVMVSHSRRHQGLQNICKYCDKSYGCRQNYSNHLRSFHPLIYHQTNNVCSLCARKFHTSKGLQLHKSRAHRTTEDVVTDTWVKCAECDLTFVNQEVYKEHIRNTPSHRKSADTLYKRTRRRQNVTCKECGATFDGYCPVWLYSHYKKKHPEIPYKVTREKTYLCDNCGKSFSLKCHLIEHLRVHTGERPFVCDECDAAFRTKVRLHMHKQFHKPPSRACKVCGKKFVSASNLSNHMRTHIGDRRYKCSICGKGFLHSSSLREHIRGVHEHVRRTRKPRQQHKKMTSKLTPSV